jgi:glyoxylase-like metal-dependent hydrolase (beta-lactamase superfamily II)
MLTLGEWQENCYLLVDPPSGEAFLVDPGDEADRVLAWLAGIKVRDILLTHGHIDHIGAVPALRSALGVRAGLHPGDDGLAASRGLQADFPLTDGDVLQLGPHKIRVFHTPGHTPGSVCLQFDTRAIVGDVVFPGGPGHTNSPEELRQSVASLSKVVFNWPDEVELFPGHGLSTTVGKERPGFEAFRARPIPQELFGDVSW